MEFYVGDYHGTVQGEAVNLTGARMYTAAHDPAKQNYPDPFAIKAILDSGAFTDTNPKYGRLTFEAALHRQLAWELKARAKWVGSYDISRVWRVYAVVSYDELIDEMSKSDARGGKVKERWQWYEADRAVERTVEAAHYLASKRTELYPRRLVLSCQGVDAIQYADCVREVLKVATPADIIGLGGWCIIGREITLLPVFWQTLNLVIPMMSAAGIKDVHIFGVTYLPALGGLTWLCDRYGINVSTDSTAPVAACTRRNFKKSRVRVASGYWRDNVAWWQNTLANIRQNKFYRKPPELTANRQLLLAM